MKNLIPENTLGTKKYRKIHRKSDQRNPDNPLRIQTKIETNIENQQTQNARTCT